MASPDSYEEIRLWYGGLQDLIETEDQFAPLRAILPANDITRQQAGDMYRLHMNAMAATYDRNDLIALICKAIDQYQRQNFCVSGIDQIKQQISDDHWQSFWQHGLLQCPSLTSDKIAAILEFLDPLPVLSNRTHPLDQAVHRDDMRSINNVGSIPSRLVLNCPGLWDLALSPEITALAGRLMGCLPTVIDIDAWWSFADAPVAKDAQQFHMDLDSHRFCKLFLYLTDVDSNGGPHVFVEGTHDPDNLNQLRPEDPQAGEQFDRWLRGQLRKSDQEVAEHLGIEPTELTGPAGSCFLVNTKGIHKGKLPENQDRLIIAIEYAPVPSLHLPILPVGPEEPFTQNVPFDRFSPDAFYMARMYLQQSR